MKFRASSKFLLPLLLFVGTIALMTLNILPNYTKLALIFLLLPIIFFVFRKEERINEKKYLIVVGFSVLATIFYDTIAQTTWLWRFPNNSVSFWILGIPIEEYIFGLWLPTIVLGIYTSLPTNKNKAGSILNKFPRIKESALFGIIFSLQLITWATLFSNPASYLKWVIFLAILPSVFLMWRKNERIDERRLLITLLIMLIAVVVIDLIFISSQAWYYNELALLGKIGIIPIDDFLFTLFNTIAIIGFYTSLPVRKNLASSM